MKEHQPYTPDIDDIIIAYHNYMTEDGTHSQDFEVSRDEFYRWLNKEHKEWHSKGYRVGYKDADYDSVQADNLSY